MKKKAIILAFIIGCVSIVGCTSNNSSNTAESSKVDIQSFDVVEEGNNMEPDKFSDFIKKCAIYYSDYVKISDYSNITYSVIRNATDDDDSYSDRKFEEIYRLISEQSEVISYPKDRLENLIQNYGDNMKKSYEYYKETDDKDASFSDFLYDTFGYRSVDKYNENVKKEAQDYLKQEMIIYNIAYNNGINITEDELKEYGYEVADYYEYDNLDEMVSKVGNVIYTEMGYQLLTGKVADYLISISTNI